MDGWIATRYGHRVRPLELDPDGVDIRDIAHALANVCRFTGHTLVHYSVAEHSVRVAGEVPPEHRLAALLHDASEAYLADLARPLKVLPEFAFYREAEDQAMRVIAAKYDFPWPLPEAVVRADNLLLATEGRDLMPARYEDWDIRKQGWPTLPDEIQPWEPVLAHAVFLATFQKLTGWGDGIVFAPASVRLALPRSVRWIWE